MHRFDSPDGARTPRLSLFMELYRLVRSNYKDDFSGSGAYLYGGRWNSKGMPALYASAHISLALLEIVVNIDRTVLVSLDHYHLLQLSIPEPLVLPFKHDALKEDWRDDRAYTRFIGDGFLKSQSGPVMEIPSAVVPEESNFMINPGHPDFQKCNIIWSESYPLDERLY